MTEQQAQDYANRLGIPLAEFYERLAAIQYAEFVNRSPQECVMAIFDRMGVKLELPLAEW